MKKIIYISGKITGCHDFQINFNKAHQDLLTWYPDAKIVNPTLICAHLNPVLHKWEDYMLVDIEHLFKCNTIYMLEGWESSKGAGIEYDIAKRLNMEFRYEHKI